MGGSAIAEPVTHAPGEDMSDLRGLRCQCSACGHVAVPRPGADFYVQPAEDRRLTGRPLLCERCFFFKAISVKATA